jgi:hypothetical protein
VRRNEEISKSSVHISFIAKVEARLLLKLIIEPLKRRPAVKFVLPMLSQEVWDVLFVCYILSWPRRFAKSL